MDYKRIENINIIENEIKNVKTNTEIEGYYNNEIFNIESKNTTYISKYSSIKNIKKMILCNNEINEEQMMMLDRNLHKKNKIINVSNSFEIEAYMESFEKNNSSSS